MNWILTCHTVILGSVILHSYSWMSNNLDLLGAVKISEHLESNPPVKILEIDDSGFNDDDIILLCLCWALRKNTNLPE